MEEEILRDLMLEQLVVLVEEQVEMVLMDHLFFLLEPLDKDLLVVLEMVQQIEQQQVVEVLEVLEVVLQQDQIILEKVVLEDPD